MGDLMASLIRYAPLQVREVEYVDPTVTLAGNDWSLSITCPWRLRRESEVVVSWDDDSVEDMIWDLAGHSLLDISFELVGERRNALLQLTGGLTLEILPDSDLDPWVMRLPEETFVGP